MFAYATNGYKKDNSNYRLYKILNVVLGVLYEVSLNLKLMIV